MRRPRVNDRIYANDIPLIPERVPTEPNVGLSLPVDTLETTPEPVPPPPSRLILLVLN